MSRPPSMAPHPEESSHPVGEPDALSAYWRRAWQEYVSALQRGFPALLARVLKDVKRRPDAGEVVLWHLYNAGWLLRAGDLLIGMDVALLDDLNVGRRERLALFGSLDALLISHQHGDHCYRGDLAVLAELGEPTVVCHPDTAEVLHQAGVADKQVVELEAGQVSTLGDLRVRALPADHRHRQIPNSIAPAATIGGVTVVHAGDNRVFEPPALDGAKGCDILIHCLYAYEESRAREGEVTWVPEMLDAQARFLANIRPRVVLLSHLAEFAHPYEKVWRFMHAGALKERLFGLAPETACPILSPGESHVYRW